MRRLLALLVAAGLVVGAVIVRGVIEDDGGGTVGDGGDLALVCASELAVACGALDARYEVTVEDAAVTAERLAATGAADLDLWAVADPWPAMVDDIRARNGFAPLFHDSVAPVVQSPLVAVAPESIGECDWSCLASGDGQIGSRSLSSGIGVLQLGAAASAYFGRADFATNDFDGSFRRWLTGFVGSVVESDEPVTRLLQSRAFFPIALSFEAEARASLDAAAESRAAGLVVLYPAPMAYVDVVVVDTSPSMDGAARLVPDLQRLLLGAGWQPKGDHSNGLPRAGVLVALRGEVG